MVWVRVRGVEVCRAATRPRVCMRHCSTEFRKHVLPRLPNPCVHALRVRMDGRKEATKIGRKKGRKGGSKEGRKEGRMDGWKEERKEGRKEGRLEIKRYDQQAESTHGQ